MNKKYLLLIYILFSMACFVFGIDFIENHKETDVNFAKGGELAYHNSSADNLYYGTNSWAVYFDFNKWYTGVDSLICQVEGIFVYSYQDRDNVVLALHDDNAKQPGALVQEKVVSLNEGWNEIDFTYAQKQKVWVVLKDQTSLNSNYVCASQGGGQHSYFKSGDAYYNFANNGFKSELLLSIKGTLLTYHTDLIIKSVSFTDELVVDARVKPVIQVANNSAATVNNPYLILNYKAPNNQLSLRDSVRFASIMMPYEVRNIEPSLFKDFILLREPMQYKLEMNIYCDNMQNEFADNNYFAKTYNVFMDELDYICVENFLQSNSTISNSLWISQDDLPENTLRLDYFPDFADQYNQTIFTEKNTWYQNFGYPNTIIQGTMRINGYMPSIYTDKFDDYLYSTRDLKTFLKAERTDIDTLNNRITFNININNANTRIFSDFIGECMMQAFLVQKYHFYEKECISVSNYLTDMKNGIALTANYGLQQSLELEIPFDQIILYDDNTIGDVILVVQAIHKPSKQILFTAAEKLPELDISVSQHYYQDNEIVADVWPNPIRDNQVLSVKSEHVAKIDIYNIKGQRVRTITDNVNSVYKWDLKDEYNKNLSSGVYFIRIKHTNTPPQMKKILLLK
ncbi:MAG: T9SS type A sorting domain-containing protein [Candidatus Cloacimonadales bacterium]|nr:T9SS type A sorting domain-containing protein [Candidatus Cloacimonadota bacterium]MDX9977818.1 T9SS type A sorting domain-containing protein [Candidatus Cloacimonadales bacterium]